MPTRVAAIGVCHWHSLYDSAYLRHLAAMEDVDIVGLHDADPRMADHRAEELGGGIPTFAHYEQMLSEVKPDFVLALGQHDQMADIGHHLLDAGIPFIMEKPMSFNAKQLRGVVEKANSTGGFAAVPLVIRLSQPIQMAKRFIEDGTYGPMTHFYARMNRPTSARYPRWGSPWMLDPSKSSGGCLRNLGNHGLDCFVYLTGDGEEIAVTGAQLSWSTHGGVVEDYASVLVRSKSGVVGTIEVGNAFPWNGTDGELKIAFRDALLVSKDDVTKLHTSEGEEVVSPEPQRGQSPGALRETMAAAAGGNRPPISVEDCYRAVRLIDLAYIAAGNPYGTAEV